MAVCTVQFVLALLAYTNVGRPAILADCVVNLVVCVIQVPSLALTRHFRVSVAVVNTVCYAVHVGFTVWLRQVVERLDTPITTPPHFSTVQYLVAIATFILMGLSLTVMWVKVHQLRGGESHDAESMETAIESESPKAADNLARQKLDGHKLEINEQGATHLHNFPMLEPPSVRTQSLHKRLSEGTLYAADPDDEWLHFNYHASLANLALYDEGSENWMETKPMVLSHLAPFLTTSLAKAATTEMAKPENFLMDALSSDPDTDWADDRTLERRQSTGQLRVKKQRSGRHRWLSQDERLQSVREKEAREKLLRGQHGSVASDATMGCEVATHAANDNVEGYLSVERSAPGNELGGDRPNFHSPPADLKLQHSPQTDLQHKLHGPQTDLHYTELYATELHGVPDLHYDASRSGCPSPTESPSRLSCIMDGLEDIPAAVPQWNAHTNAAPHKITTVSLDQWEQNKHAWLAHPHSGRPNLYAAGASGTLSRASSAPSLHTFRQVSRQSTCKSSEFAPADAAFGATLTPVATVRDTAAATTAAPENASPMRKMMDIFKRRDSVVLASSQHSPRKSPAHKHSFSQSMSQSFAHSPSHKHSFLFSQFSQPSHKHTQSVANSMASMLASLASGKSARSDSPRKAIKGLFTRSPVHPPPAPKFPHYPLDPLRAKNGAGVIGAAPGANGAGANGVNGSGGNEGLLPGYCPSWEIDWHENSGSRLSSVPSAIVGEYDKEKWRTLKELERQAELDMACGAL